MILLLLSSASSVSAAFADVPFVSSLKLLWNLVLLLSESYLLVYSYAAYRLNSYLLCLYL